MTNKKDGVRLEYTCFFVCAHAAHPRHDDEHGYHIEECMKKNNTATMQPPLPAARWSTKESNDNMKKRNNLTAPTIRHVQNSLLRRHPSSKRPD